MNLRWSIQCLSAFRAHCRPAAWIATFGAGEWITNLQGSLQSAATGWEYPMVRFMEREGYDVSYATNVDVDRDPDRVARHRAFLSVGHDEYWSAKMRCRVRLMKSG